MKLLGVPPSGIVKNTHPRWMAKWQFSQEGGLMAHKIRVGGGSEPKNSSSGVPFNFKLG